MKACSPVSPAEVHRGTVHVVDSKGSSCSSQTNSSLILSLPVTVTPLEIGVPTTEFCHGYGQGDRPAALSAQVWCWSIYRDRCRPGRVVVTPATDIPSGAMGKGMGCCPGMAFVTSGQHCHARECKSRTPLCTITLTATDVGVDWTHIGCDVSVR